ncbi:MAG: YceI family protein, partial [Bacteroidota bacterium]
MQKQLIMFLTLGLMFAACSKAPEGKKVAAEAAQEVQTLSEKVDTLSVDLASSQVEWLGTKPGGDSHQGNISIKSGYLLVLDNMIAGGEFVLDMTSIAVTDLSGGKKTDLEGHLKTGDFFEVETYPEATFTITNTSENDQDSAYSTLITGNLAMKDSLKAIEIPAQVVVADGVLKAETPQFTIDRTQWGVMYRSGIIGTVKDKLINDQVGLRIQLNA